MAVYHGGGHGTVVIFPCGHDVGTGDENDAATDVRGVVHAFDTCKYLPVVAYGFPQAAVFDCIDGEVFVHHLKQVVEVAGFAVGVCSVAFYGKKFVEEECLFKECLARDCGSDFTVCDSCADR